MDSVEIIECSCYCSAKQTLIMYLSKYENNPILTTNANGVAMHKPMLTENHCQVAQG